MNIYQEQILDHYRHPRHQGVVNQPTHRAHQTNPLCGDELTITAVVHDDKLAEVKFDGHGCAVSQAGASMLAEALHGQPMERVSAFTDQDMLELIGVELTPARQKCALLAAATLRKALPTRTL